MKFRFGSRAPLLLLAALLLPAQSFAQRPGAKRRAPVAPPSVRFTGGQSSASVPFDLAGNLIFMRARVNGSEPLWFIFDTGATHTVVDTGQAKALGLKARGRIVGTGTAGTAVASRVRGVSVGFEGVELTGQTVYTLPIDFLSAPVGRRVGGVIGNDIIKEFVVEIDYANRTLRFHDPAGFRYEGAGEVLPLSIEAEGNVFVNAQVELEGRAPLTGRFEVDTGSTGSIALNAPFVRKHGLLSFAPKAKRVNLGGVGGTAGALMTRVRALRLGRFAFPFPVARFSLATKGDAASARYDGIMGGAVFSRFKMFVDLGRRRMILEPNEAAFAAPFEDDMSGAELVADGPDLATYLIDDVEEGSPAAEAGIRGGDVIAAIDARPASEFTLEEVRRMFMQDGREYLLTLKRGDQLVKIKIKLRRLI